MPRGLILILCLAATACGQPAPRPAPAVLTGSPVLPTLPAPARGPRMVDRQIDATCRIFEADWDALRRAGLWFDGAPRVVPTAGLDERLATCTAATLSEARITLWDGQMGNTQFVEQYAYIADYDLLRQDDGSVRPDPRISVLDTGAWVGLRPVAREDLCILQDLTIAVCDRLTTETLDGRLAPGLRLPGRDARASAGQAWPLEVPVVADHVLPPVSAPLVLAPGQALLTPLVCSVRRPSPTALAFLGGTWQRPATAVTPRQRFCLITTTVRKTEPFVGEIADFPPPPATPAKPTAPPADAL